MAEILFQFKTDTKPQIQDAKRTTRRINTKKPIIWHVIFKQQKIRDKKKNLKRSQRSERKGDLLHCWWDCKLIQLLQRTVWKFLKILGINLRYDPQQATILQDTCTPIFTAALFTIARTWKQPSCPSTDERIKKMWYIYTIDYYLAIKKE